VHHTRPNLRRAITGSNRNCGATGVLARRGHRPRRRLVFFASFAVKRLCLLVGTLLALRSIRTCLTLIPITSQHGQPRIFRKSRIRKRKLTHHKHRAAVRFDPPSMLAIGAQTGFRFIEIVAARHRFCARPTPPESGSESTTSAPACAPTPHRAPHRCWTRQQSQGIQRQGRRPL